ncbi:MAG: glycosyltransferase family 2 protein [Flavobacteriaceae bacterium]|nr:glycosyltransferase family 2 protein [Flavobacteriaceae bacterium]
MPKFSVVISVYNKEKYISKTINSVLNQTFTDFEIVVLNDGSTDKSEDEILAINDSRIRYFSEKNQGAGAGRNYVISKAKGNYIALLDADDIWFPFYLEEQNRLINKYPEQNIFATNSEFLKKGNIIKKEYSININSQKDLVVNFFESSYLSSIINSSSAVITNSAIKKIGNYNPFIKSGQDTDFFIRLGLIFPVVFSSRVCVQIVILENSLSRRTKSVSEKTNFNAFEDSEKTNKALKRFIDLNRFSICLLAIKEGNKKGYYENLNKIDLANLNKKQRFLLKQSRFTILLLMKLKLYLEKLGLSSSVFK